MTKMLGFTPDVKMPIDLLMQPIGLLGNRGGGKTYSGMKLFEAAHDAGVQCIAVDVVGKWWALRLGADGHSRGLADVYIFGGKRADFPIDPDNGKFVAKIIAERRIHAVLDLSLVPKGPRRKFLTDFAEEYFLLKKQEDVPTPCVLFLEEAHALLPQKTMPGEERMLGAFQDLVAEGRNAGIGVVVMDQRPATVNKNALALVEVLIVLRTTYKNDRDVYRDWIVQKVVEGADAVRLSDELPFLKTGQGYLYAPQFDIFSKIQISPKRTFDSSATVKIGEKLKSVGTLTPVDVEQLKTAMAAVLEKVKSDDPRLLRKRIAELELQLKQSPAKSVEVPVITDKQVQQLEQFAKTVLEGQEKLAAAMVEIVPGMRKVHAFHMDMTQSPGAKLAAKLVNQLVSPRTPTNGHAGARVLTQADFSPKANVGDIQIKRGARLMAGILAGSGPLTRKELGAMSGFSHSSGTFSEYINVLLRSGIVSLLGDGRLTSSAEPIATSWEDIVSRWGSDFKAGVRAMLSTVRNGPVTRSELGEFTGFSHTSGTFSEYVNKLKHAGLVVEENRVLSIPPLLATL